MKLKNLEKKCGEFLKKTLRGKKKPLIVLLGPTASGKTALSLKLAKALDAEIISADSRQVYRGMDIGTDKILPEKRGGIPHHLFDIVDPDERFTVVDFKKRAEKIIEEILRRKKIPMLVGGTGLYITALTENFQIPETGDDLKYRKKMEDEMRKRGEKGKKWLHKKLAEVDPETAAKIPAQSYLYVLRALEIFHLTGKPKQDRRGKQKYETLKIGLKWDKEKLIERIAERVENQFKRGLVEEVRGFLKKGYSKNLAALRSIGYREVIQYLKEEISLEEAKNLMTQNTRQFARRQMSWFKRDPKILWLEGH